MNFLNLPDTKETVNFTVVFLEEKTSQFNTATVSIPGDKKVKNLIQFLASVRTNPFRSFFLTNKIKEKPQFTQQKQLRELKEECKRDNEGNYVLLCYQQKESKIQGAISSGSLQDAAQAKTATPASAEEKKDESSCKVM